MDANAGQPERWIRRDGAPDAGRPGASDREPESKAWLCCSRGSSCFILTASPLHGSPANWNGELACRRRWKRFAGLYDRRLVTLLRVGEQTGRLPEMLVREGDVLTGELEHRLRSLGNLLEPVLILLVGLLVAVILVAMYLPMFRLGGIMG